MSASAAEGKSDSEHRAPGRTKKVSPENKGITGPGGVAFLRYTEPGWGDQLGTLWELGAQGPGHPGLPGGGVRKASKPKVTRGRSAARVAHAGGAFSFQMWHVFTFLRI